MMSRTWQGGIGGRGFGRESNSKTKRSHSEAGLHSFNSPFKPDKWHQTPQYPPPMDEDTSSSFSFCDDQDLTTALAPSFSTDNIFTPGACSQPGSNINIDKQPSPEHHPKKTTRSSRLKTEVDKLIDVQNDVSMRRAQVGELRVGLGYKREEEVELRVAFMKKLNMFFAPNVAQDAQLIAKDYEKLQSVTEGYLELERNYAVAEDELGGQEYGLVLGMERLSGLLRRASSAVEDDDDGQDDEDYAHDEGFACHEDTTFAPPTMQNPMPPSMVEYLTRMGDMEMLQERLCELDTEYMAISDKQQTRNQFNLPMDEDSLEFLSDYQERRPQTLAELENTIAEVNRLHAVCQSQGLVADEQAECFNIVDGDELGLEDTDHHQQQSDPLKITTMAEDPHPFFEPSNTTKFDRSNFINKWILHQLRHSSLQISRLKSLPELRELAENQGCDEMSISRLALDVWYMDGAVMVEPPSTEDGVDAIINTTGNDANAIEDQDPQENGYLHTENENKEKEKATAKEKEDPRSVLRRKSEPIRRPKCWSDQNQNHDSRRFRFRSISCGIL